jgi:hypothetical protein
MLGLHQSFLSSTLSSFRVFRAFCGRNDPNDLSTSDFALRGIEWGGNKEISKTFRRGMTASKRTPTYQKPAS